MSTLELIEVDIQDNDGKNITYEWFVNQCLASPPKEGMTFQDFEDRHRIKNSIKKGKLVLEDADCKNFKKIVDAMRWALTDDIIFDFLKAVKAL